MGPQNAGGEVDSRKWERGDPVLLGKEPYVLYCHEGRGIETTEDDRLPKCWGVHVRLFVM